MDGSKREAGEQASDHYDKKLTQRRGEESGWVVKSSFICGWNFLSIFRSKVESFFCLYRTTRKRTSQSQKFIPIPLPTNTMTLTREDRQTDRQTVLLLALSHSCSHELICLFTHSFIH
mmetsp:Transcript_13216/g.26056  ORF Transcript_13216/g.26056 Transcript_13216/m.26056 type:complete len:118 (-) Transcript_13216:1133-1486(-)